MDNIIRRILREEVSEKEIESGFEEFHNLFKEKYGKEPNFESVFEEIEKDIKKSPTPKISITNQGMFCGMSLTDNVILSKSIFSRDLYGFIFVLFHEIAHQYQYKKYGKNLLYELTTKEVTEDTLNKLIDIEQVADRFGRSMAQKYGSKFNLKTSTLVSPYDNIQYGKNSYRNLILTIQKEIEKGDITCVEQMESFMLDHLTKPIPTYTYTGSSYYPKYEYSRYSEPRYSTYDDSDYEREYSKYEKQTDLGDFDVEDYESSLTFLQHEINDEINNIIDEVGDIYGETGQNVIRKLLNEEGFTNFYFDNEYVETDEEVDDIEELTFKVDEDFYSIIMDLKKYIEEKLQKLMDSVEEKHGFDGINVLSDLIEKHGFDDLWINY